jgi:hypothetical protein
VAGRRGAEEREEGEKEEEEREEGEKEEEEREEGEKEEEERGGGREGRGGEGGGREGRGGEGRRRAAVDLEKAHASGRLARVDDAVQAPPTEPAREGQRVLGLPVSLLAPQHSLRPAPPRRA